jgi:hypothetical protein
MSEPIRLTPEQQEMLARLAAKSGKTWEEVFQEAMDSFDQRAKHGNGDASVTVYQALVQTGLLGCIHDAPADLSTNPAYMEGFGSSGQ